MSRALKAAMLFSRALRPESLGWAESHQNQFSHLSAGDSYKTAAAFGK